MKKPWELLAVEDPEVFRHIEDEFSRQRRGIELIASENFTSRAVMVAASTILTNKYAEGLPGKRYYGGCEYVDALESLAIQRAKDLFGSAFANVQPHSGAQANAAVMLTLAKPGDAMLGLDLSHGGHLTHGSKVNSSGSFYESHFYQVDPETERLDYDQILRLAKEIKPRVLVAGASAYARSIDFARFRAIADEVGAYLMVDMAHIAGLVAAGEHASPIPHAHVVTTTTHKTLRGPRGGLILWNDPELNFNKGVFPGTQGGPLEHIIAAKAVCFKEAQHESFRTYQQQVVRNAKVLGEELVKAGMRLVSGGTDNHLVLLDLSDTDCTGKDLEQSLGKIEITVNKNTVPREKRSPFVTSGVRLGSPAVTTRGFKEDEMKTVARLIQQCFENRAKLDVLENDLKPKVMALAERFPLYPEWS